MKQKFESKPEIIEVTSPFWAKWRQKIYKEVIPYQWEVINDERSIVTPFDPGEAANSQDIEPNYSHAVRNLRIAAGEEKGNFSGFVFQDSDVYKWLEEAAHCLVYTHDKKLQKQCDELIDLIGRAQQPDGYLMTPFQIKSGRYKRRKRFTQIHQSHEMYTMGHYIEAAVAYYRATGNKKALDIAEKMANCLDNNFGPEAQGKIPGSGGHPEIELALAKLYEVTKKEKYLKLAKFFVEIRGQDPYFYDRQNEKIGDGSTDIFPIMRKWTHEYSQAARPLKMQETAQGHCVRVVYLLTGAAHVGRLSRDASLLTAVRKIWGNIVHKRMYITGAVGQQSDGESFTYDYDLPNDTMYGESCAAVAMAMLAAKMNQVELRGEYGDVLEKEMFNAALSGIALDGKHFFYVNPLEVDPYCKGQNSTKKHVLLERAEWFTCACCPSNIARFIASIHRYLYTLSEEDRIVCAHQFVANKTTVFDDIKVEQKSNFPWDGNVEFKVNIPKGVKPINFVVRIPSWSAKKYSIKHNGKHFEEIKKEGMIYIKMGPGKHKVTMELDMSIKLMRANTAVREDSNRVCVMRGPVVYCAEGADNATPMWNYVIRYMDMNVARAEYRPFLLDGVTVLYVPTFHKEIEPTNAPLYQEITNDNFVKFERKTMKMIPYYAWANRGTNAMMVWFDVSFHKKGYNYD